MCMHPSSTGLESQVLTRYVITMLLVFGLKHILLLAPTPWNLLLFGHIDQYHTLAEWGKKRGGKGEPKLYQMNLHWNEIWNK